MAAVVLMSIVMLHNIYITTPVLTSQKSELHILCTQIMTPLRCLTWKHNGLLDRSFIF